MNVRHIYYADRVSFTTPYPRWPNTGGSYMTLKYSKYIPGADDEAVIACIAAIRPLYDLYTPNDIAESIHQIRREFNLIEERVERKRKIADLTAEDTD